MGSWGDFHGKSSADEVERICVVQIRMQTGDHVAIVSELRDADRLLISWLKRTPQDFLEFRIQIAFQDGFVFDCRHDFERDSRLKPSLSKLLRAAFSGRSEAIGQLPASPERYEVNYL